MRRLGQVDLSAYARGFVLLARHPQIALAPLLAAVFRVLLFKILPSGSDDGLLGAANSGLAGLIAQLVQGFGFSVALIVAESAWRRGRAPFDDAWDEARAKLGSILFATLGFTFIIYVASLIGSVLGFIGSAAMMLVALFFFIYALPAAAIGGIPGGASLQASLERAQRAPLATGLVTILFVFSFFAPSLIVTPLLPALLSVDSAYAGSIVSIITAIAEALILGYVSIVLAKMYDDASYGRFR